MSRYSFRSKRIASSSLKQKMENAPAAGDRICVITDNIATLQLIQGSIAQWSVFVGRSVKLYIPWLIMLKEVSLLNGPWYVIEDFASDWTLSKGSISWKKPH